MIVTLTPNPSVDRTTAVPALVRGAVLRGVPRSVEPSGKGLNVALALARQGRDAVAVLPAGGPTGAVLARLLVAQGPATGHLRVEVVPVAGDVRTNTSLLEPDGTVTKVNEPGPHLSAVEVGALLAATGAAASQPGAQWLASCGSLPPGAPEDLHAQVVRLGHGRGLRVVVDSSGAALRAALRAGPDLVKPNAEELAEAAGVALRTLGDVVDAARALRRAGAASVLVSLGADGAVLLDGDGDGDGAVHATAAVPRVLSTVGAGDALLAGYLAATSDQPDSPHAALREALRWGAAAVGSASTLFTLDGEAAVVHLAEPDRQLVLREPVPGPS